LHGSFVLSRVVFSMTFLKKITPLFSPRTNSSHDSVGFENHKKKQAWMDCPFPLLTCRNQGPPTNEKNNRRYGTRAPKRFGENGSHPVIEPFEFQSPK
jgi:hypothetical protein